MIELRLSRVQKPQDVRDAKQKQEITRLRVAHEDRLHRFCLRLSGGNHADADDLAQETWCAAYESLPRFRGQAQVTTWLFRIAVYRWRQMRQNLPAISDTTDAIEHVGRVADSAPATLDRLALADALLLLPDSQREAFLLVKAEQFTHREASAILQIPQGTVQARVHDAVRRLRILLTEDDEDEMERNHD